MLLANSAPTSDEREIYYSLVLDAPVTTKWVKIDVQSSQHHNLRVSEVEFRFDDAIPEPTGAALLGVAGLSLLRRPRK